MTRAGRWKPATLRVAPSSSCCRDLDPDRTSGRPSTETRAVANDRHRGRKGACGSITYTCGMADAVTTMKITTATRDRLRTHAATGESLEDVVVHALDAYETAQFWARAEAWAATETPDERAKRKASEAEWDALLDGLR